METGSTKNEIVDVNNNGEVASDNFAKSSGHKPQVGNSVDENWKNDDVDDDETVGVDENVDKIEKEQNDDDVLDSHNGEKSNGEDHFFHPDTANDGGEITENVDENEEELNYEVLHLQNEEKADREAQYSHPDIVLRKETTFLSYHDSDSDLIDYNLDTGSLFPATGLDKSDADSWDWTFHDENVSDLDIKVIHAPRKRSSLLSNKSESFFIKTPEDSTLNQNTNQSTTDNQTHTINSPHELNIENPATNYPKNCTSNCNETAHTETAGKSCLLQARKFKNPTVSFTSPRISSNGFSQQKSENFRSCDKFENEFVYFEDLNSSRILKTRLKFLGSNCNVGSKVFCSRGSKMVAIDGKTKKRKYLDEIVPPNSKQGKLTVFGNLNKKLSELGNVNTKLSKLEEMFVLSGRQFRNSENVRENFHGDKSSLSSPLSASLSKSEFSLPQIGDTQIVSSSGKSQAMIGQAESKLIGWKQNKNRSMSKLNMFSKKSSVDDSENVLNKRQDSSKKYQHLSGLGKFRYFTRLVLLLLRAVGLKPKKQDEHNYNFMSWSLVFDEVQGVSRLKYDNGALSFDPLMYRANKDATLSQETKDILRLPSHLRTEANVHSVMVNLHNMIQSFSEFPKRIQQSMVKVCLYERFEAGRVIIRQGHRAENFYFILSGSALVSKMESGSNQVHTISALVKGDSFGELAFLHMSKRAATVSCREDVELISIERNDFIDIFMRPSKGREPDHITFLKSLDLLQGWPFHLLPHDNPKICAFTYVRRGVILCQNNMKSDWIFVVYSGNCKVLAALDDKPIRRKDERSRLPLMKKIPTSLQYIDLANLKNYTSVTVLNRNANKEDDFQQQDSIKLQEHSSKKFNKEIHENQQNSAHQESRHRDGGEEERQQAHQENDRDEESQQLNQNNEQKENTFEQESRQYQKNRVPYDSSSNENSAVFGFDTKENSDHSEQTGNEKKIFNETNNEFLLSTSCDQQAQDNETNPSSPSKVSFQTSSKSPTHSLFKQKQQTAGLYGTPGPERGQGTQSPEQHRNIRKTTFVEIGRLEAGDVFALEHIVLAGMRDIAVCSLVSQGAEVILISRSFFRKHLTEETMKRMRLTIRPLPSEKSLQKKFETKKIWEEYKSQTMARQTFGSRRLNKVV